MGTQSEGNAGERPERRLGTIQQGRAKIVLPFFHALLAVQSDKRITSLRLRTHHGKQHLQ